MRLEAERGVVENFSTSKDAIAAGREPHFDVTFILHILRPLMGTVSAGALRAKQQSFLSAFLSKHQDHVRVVSVFLRHYTNRSMDCKPDQVNAVFG